jgi:hypothetical protein
MVPHPVSRPGRLNPAGSSGSRCGAESHAALRKRSEPRREQERASGALPVPVPPRALYPGTGGVAPLDPPGAG